MDIKYLLFLQYLRELSGGVLNTFVLTLTSFGEAMLTWGLLAAVYWCIDKRAGQLMAFNVSFGSTLNQAVKRMCKIERPWIQDSRIMPVEAALNNAGGYSFPSGHTTRVTATWGALSRELWKRSEKAISLICCSICILVAFSRNYLGVHTAKDVLAALLVGIVLIFLLDYCLDWVEKGKNRDVIVVFLGGMIFLLCMLKVGCLSNAGAGIGLLIGWMLERRYIRFEIGESIREKAFRFLIGGALLGFLYTVPNVILSYFMEAKYAGFFSQFLFAIMLMAGYPFVFSRLKNNTKAFQKLCACVLVAVIGITGIGTLLYQVFEVSKQESNTLNSDYKQNEVQIENDKIQQPETNSDETVKVIAHRGYSSQFPENTLASFNGACELGVDYIETDVQCTKDGVLVLFHDTDLGRVTGVQGNVIDYTYDELRNMDAGAWFGEEFAGERIPTLKELLELLQDKDCNLYLELKDIGSVEGFEEKVVEEVRQYNMMNRCLFASFNYDYLCNIKEIDDNAKILLNTTSDKASLVKEYPADYYGLYLESTSAQLLDAIHQSDRKAFIWTVDSPQAMANEIALGADGLVSNRPGVAEVAMNAQYESFTQLYESSFSLPGLYDKDLPDRYEDVVVQGLTKTSQNLIISAYSKAGDNSILYVMNLSGKLVNIVDLGFVAHTGGISYDAQDDYLWITGPDGMVYAISCSEVINGTYTGNILVSFDAGLLNHNQNRVASFLTYFEGELFVGSYVKGANGVLNRYDLSQADEPQLSASMAIPEKVQGVTFWKNQKSGKTRMYLSQSCETDDSTLMWFDYDMNNMEYLNPSGSCVLPEGSEQIQATASGLYVLFESAALPYKDTARIRNDQVYLIRFPVN